MTAAAAVAAVLAVPGPPAPVNTAAAPAPITAPADQQPVSAAEKPASGTERPRSGQRKETASAPAVPARKSVAQKAKYAKDTDVPGDFTSWEQLFRVQGKMNETAHALEDSAGQKRGQGFAGVIAAPEKKRLTLYWRGALTPAAKAAIASSATPVVVKQAPHTEKELSQVSPRVARLADSAGVRLTEIIRPQDGSGLKASVEGGEAEAARLTKAVTAAGLGVPVTVTAGGEVPTSLGRRDNPGLGGAQMVTPVCSTGFAVRYGGKDAMLTADHCFPRGYGDGRHSVGPEGQPNGPVFGSRVSPKRWNDKRHGYVDVAVLDQSYGTVYEPSIWTGGRAGYPDTTQQAVPVTAAQKPAEGNWVCQSGARSGEVCNIRVTAAVDTYSADVTDSEGNTTTTFYAGGWQAKKRVTAGDSSTIAARSGDSGGPVYFSAGEDAGTGSTVTAAGIVSAGLGKPLTCQTVGTGTTRCFKTMVFLGIDEALNALDGVVPTELTVTDSWDPSVRRLVNFRGEEPNQGPPVQPEPDLRTQVVSENGVALAYDATKDGYDGVIRGNDQADWEIHQASDGSWTFQNVAHPSNLLAYPDGSGFRFVPAGGPYFQLRHGDSCLAIELVMGPTNIGDVWEEGCDSGKSSQRLKIVPLGDATSGPLEPVPPVERVIKAPATKPAPGPGLAVMPLGDSITLGVGSTTRTGYRPLLARRLADTTDALRFVGSMRDADGTRHEGHSGWRIDQLQANIGPWLTEAKPNVVLLHIGTNDMDRDHQVSTAPQRLGALIDQIHTASPDTAVVVASLVPATEPAVQARVTAYNRAIPGIVADRAARGYRITQVSMDSLTTADLNDTLHPNNSGYEKMAESFLGGIATLSRNGWIKEKIDVKPLPPQQPATAGDYDVDIDGDGRADYLVVDDNGAVRAYTNTAGANGTVKWTDQGYIASGSATWTGSQVRFADIGGDARADYLVVEPNGATRAFVNTGGDGRGGWQYQGYIASGSAAWTGDRVRFGDIGGDARADYLIVEPNGATRAFLTTTNATTGAVKLVDQGVIASGSAAWTGDQIRFADIGGDARADYLIVEPNGATRAFVNTGGNGRGGWDDRGTVASGSTTWTGSQVRFADIGGDGRADYLIVEPNGAIRAFTNTSTPTGPVKWTDQGVIATGTGAPSSRIRI
ncbi:GDSL-type esterase/lipase family protein [Streptomyces jumonjinensis]|uniref:GDSL-type esterase/lipase family protein n=1 Tax=Streptomyces jumonjinensis TaxID=1945 RepID=UPI00331AE84F